MKKIVLISFLLLSLHAAAQQTDVYKNPATSWNEDVISISQGNFSACFLGGITQETIRWSGSTIGYADTLQSVYPAGEIVLDFPGYKTAEDYSRRLDTLTNIASTHILTHGTDMLRELFFSRRHRVMVLHLHVPEDSKALNFRVSLRNDHGQYAEINDRMLKICKTDSTHCSEILLKVKTDAEGAAVTDRDCIRVIDAHEVTLYLASGTRSLQPNVSYKKRDQSAHRLHRNLLLRLKPATLRAYHKIKAAQSKK